MPNAAFVIAPPATAQVSSRHEILPIRSTTVDGPGFLRGEPGRKT